jgi:hypothetical protein
VEPSFELRAIVFFAHCGARFPNARPLSGLAPTARKHRRLRARRPREDFEDYEDWFRVTLPPTRTRPDICPGMSGVRVSQRDVTATALSVTDVTARAVSRHVTPATAPKRDQCHVCASD